MQRKAKEKKASILANSRGVTLMPIWSIIISLDSTLKRTLPDKTDWRSERPMGAAAAAAAAAAGPPVVGVAVADPAAAAEEFEEESFLGAAGVAAGAEDCAGVEAADAVL